MQQVPFLNPSAHIAEFGVFLTIFLSHLAENFPIADQVQRRYHHLLQACQFCSEQLSHNYTECLELS